MLEVSLFTKIYFSFIRVSLCKVCLVLKVLGNEQIFLHQYKSEKVVGGYSAVLAPPAMLRAEAPLSGRPGRPGPRILPMFAQVRLLPPEKAKHHQISEKVPGIQFGNWGEEEARRILGQEKR